MSGVSLSAETIEKDTEYQATGFMNDHRESGLNRLKHNNGAYVGCIRTGQHENSPHGQGYLITY